MASEALKTSTTESRLRQMIDSRAEIATSASVLDAWGAFKQFARLSVEDAPEQEFLFECGVYHFDHLSDRPMFLLDFVRQFTLEVDGEYDHMEQLRLRFMYEPVDELRSLKASFWSMNMGGACDAENFDAFILAVEDDPAFQLVSSGIPPVKVTMSQEEL